MQLACGYKVTKSWKDQGDFVFSRLFMYFDSFSFLSMFCLHSLCCGDVTLQPLSLFPPHFPPPVSSSPGYPDSSPPPSLPRCQVVTHWRRAAKDLASLDTHTNTHTRTHSTRIQNKPRVQRAGHMLHVLHWHAHTEGLLRGQTRERRVDALSHTRNAPSAKWKALNLLSHISGAETEK